MDKKLNRIQIGLEDENRPSFKNYLKDMLSDEYNLPDDKKPAALKRSMDYGDLLFYIGLKHDVEALKIVRDEIGLVYNKAGLGTLIEAILENEPAEHDRDIKNEMISILADCGWYLPKHSRKFFGDNDRYVTYLILRGITKENTDKIMRPLSDR